MQSHTLSRSSFLSASRPVLSTVRPISRQQLHVCNSAVAQPAPIPFKTTDGSEKGSKQLELKVAQETAKGLVHRYLVMVLQNQRRGTASTLTRSEVRGGGRKPFRQKGTGNARRGSTRSPLIPGGGVTFGPKPKDWSVKMNKKERRLALATALQSAAEDMSVIENLDGKVADGKTKSLLQLLSKVGIDAMKTKTLIIVNSPEASPDRREMMFRAGRNVENVYINYADKIKVFDVLKAHKIIIEEGALDFVNSFYGGKKDKEASSTSAPAPAE